MWDKENEFQIFIRNGLFSQKQVIERCLTSLENNYYEQNGSDDDVKKWLDLIKSINLIEKIFTALQLDNYLFLLLSFFIRYIDKCFFIFFLLLLIFFAKYIDNIFCKI